MKLTLAVANFNKGLELRKKIADKTGTINAKHNVAKVCIYLAVVSSEDKNYSEAQKYYNEALKIYESISIEHPTYSISNDIDKIYRTLGMFTSNDSY